MPNETTPQAMSARIADLEAENARLRAKSSAPIPGSKGGPIPTHDQPGPQPGEPTPAPQPGPNYPNQNPRSPELHPNPQPGPYPPER
jgi:hypothetical protein